QLTNRGRRKRMRDGGMHFGIGIRGQPQIAETSPRNVRIGARRRESETKRKRLDLPGDGVFPHDGPRSGKSSRTFALFCVSRSTAVSCACGTVILSRHIASPAMASVSLSGPAPMVVNS